MAKKLVKSNDEKNRADAKTEDAKPKRRGRPPKPREVIPFVSGIPEGDVVQVGLEEIDFNDTELEFRVDWKLKDLIEDIARNGQQFPVILRKSDDKYQIVSGFRRCRSIRALEWPTVQAIVREDLDDDQAFRISFLENERRKSLTGVDKANAIVKLRIKGKSDTDIQEIYGIGERQIRRYKEVATFPDVLRVAIINGRIQTTHGLALNKVINDHDIEKVKPEEWIDRIEEDGLSVRKLTRDLNAKFKKRKVKPRYIDRRRDGGFRIYPMKFDPVSTSKATRKKMLGVFRDAIERIEKAE